MSRVRQNAGGKKREVSEDDSILSKVLAAREERALVQKCLLSVRGVSTLVQISLNIPGYPKRLDNDLDAVAEAERLFLRGFESNPEARVMLTNEAGAAILLAYTRPDAVEAKKHAIDIEIGASWGRVLDIDVLTATGPISRDTLGIHPRKCIICENNAKICSREGNHSAAEVRKAAQLLLQALHSSKNGIDPCLFTNFICNDPVEL